MFRSAECLINARTSYHDPSLVGREDQSALSALWHFDHRSQQCHLCTPPKDTHARLCGPSVCALHKRHRGAPVATPWLAHHKHPFPRLTTGILTSLARRAYTIRWARCEHHLYAESVAGPMHLACRIDDCLAHRPLVEHRQLYRDLQGSASTSGFLRLPSICMHVAIRPCEGLMGLARRHRAFNPHLGIDHAVCSWVRQRTSREFMLRPPAGQFCLCVYFDVRQDLQGRTCDSETCCQECPPSNALRKVWGPTLYMRSTLMSMERATATAISARSSPTYSS